MRVLIKNAKVVSPSSPFHGQSVDLFIENGFISAIGNNLDCDVTEIIEKEGLHVSIGWMDCFANFGEPGFEYNETFETGSMAAAAGGFTQVMLIPNTRPVIDNKSQIEYIIQKSKNLPVNILPIGAVTKNAGGKDLAEMYDMYRSGAVAFSDGVEPIQSSGILQKALEYLLAIDATLIQLPDDKSIGSHGLMNEGVISTRLGLQGKPSIAEELLVARDIELAKYTGSKIHITGLSTKKSLDLVAAAKAAEIGVTCSVTPYHLFFSDEDLITYDTNLKVNPPIRTVEDRDALLAGIKNETVDFIASHHQPQDWDHKVCEFEYANNGMEGLESVFAASHTSGVSFGQFVKMQTENVRHVFNLPIPEIKEKQQANLTLFIPDEEFVLDEAAVFSRSRNNAFIGKSLKGKVIGIINADKVFLSDSLTIAK